MEMYRLPITETRGRENNVRREQDLLKRNLPVGKIREEDEKQWANLHFRQFIIIIPSFHREFPSPSLYFSVKKG